MQYKFGKISITLAALALPVGLIVSGLVALYFKSHNPNHIDITAQLAYLRPILISLVVTFAVFLIAGIVFAILGLKNDTDKHLSKLAIILLVGVSLLSILAGSIQQHVNKTEDSYKKVQTQDFFKKLLSR